MREEEGTGLVASPTETLKGRMGMSQSRSMVEELLSLGNQNHFSSQSFKQITATTTVLPLFISLTLMLPS